MHGSPLKAAFGLPLVRRAAHRLRRRRLAILMYHGVTASPLPVPNWCHMPASEFREQMRFLSETYEVLPLPEALSRLDRNEPLPDLAACVTFDDAFKTVSSVAAPILKEHAIPFTVFVVTGLAETGRSPWPETLFSAVADTRCPSVSFRGRGMALATPEDRAAAYAEMMTHLRGIPVERKDEELATLLDALGRASGPTAFDTMTWSDIDSLKRGGLASFGAHSDTHEILTRCSEERARAEIRTARRKMLEHGVEGDGFAYPNGDRNEAVKQMVRDEGFRWAVTADHGLAGRGSDLFELSRIGIGAGLTAEEFEVKMLGF